MEGKKGVMEGKKEVMKESYGRKECRYGSKVKEERQRKGELHEIRKDNIKERRTI